ncbi:PhoPQ-activated pathogenicity-related family protein [Lacipirellula sp.]|uniref:PhoPQ-activated pathogenicity-related family protein n=1 Tax=Lacipirellula sp. TaxID=2691419 RepID=UPI003D0BDB8A
MRFKLTCLLACVALSFCLQPFCAAKEAPPAATAAATSPLIEYVQQADPNFKWEVAKKIEGNPSETTVIKLTSQGWRSPDEVDRTVWEHYLVVVKPAKLTTNKAFLIVAGGGNDRPAPDDANMAVRMIAEATGSIVAELKMVPNQPLIFHGDGTPRKEDDLIGYGWAQFLETGDAKWLPRLPMVKSVAAAMDCLQEWSKGEGAPIEKFVVAGASKRGWTTWMIGAVDPRVEAIVPIVIDVVNCEQTMRHHAAVYGFWATSVGNYYQHKILQRSTHPRMHELYTIEDPYFYLDRLTMPKYIVNASGDQFFCPDSSQFYFDDLKGEKHLRYVPNADHSVDGSIDAVTSIVAFYQMLLADRPRPETKWTFEAGGNIRVTTDQKPRAVKLWQAVNPDARDFRVETIGKAYQSTDLQPQTDGSYVAKIATPKKGWIASFVELEYDSGGSFPFKVTTSVRVLPETRPFEGINLDDVPYEPILQKGGK